ncbi:HNH endonuclease [Sandaracinobacteroides hominis]|uniref:HNH endonuclease n=1 Tax=Sandaracinobacteroides hominis TaxID=2780086 RepID=UPI0018F4F161|nr:HNH endonuclease [Sandaracinobacteroides hominis]
MADAIYSTARWRRLRRAKLVEFPLCQDCEAAGRLKPAEAVDHVIPVRLGGEAFPALSGLRSLCNRCHSRKTARGPEAGAVWTDKPIKGCDASGRPTDPEHPWNGGGQQTFEALLKPPGLRRSAVPVVLVCGPSGAGKSTWARKHAGPADLILDLDDIKQQVSGLPRYATSREVLAKALKARNAILSGLWREQRYDHVFFIVGAPTSAERTWWIGQLGGRVELIATPLDECLRRITADPERTTEVARMIRAAQRWWLKHAEDTAPHGQKSHHNVRM